MDSLNLLYQEHFTNELIHHDPTHPPYPTKLPLDVPIFEGNSGEDPQNHVMSFKLWCFLNFVVNDFIRLYLHQRNFTRIIAKWYID